MAIKHVKTTFLLVLAFMTFQTGLSAEIFFKVSSANKYSNWKLNQHWIELKGSLSQWNSNTPRIPEKVIGETTLIFNIDVGSLVSIAKGEDLIVGREYRLSSYYGHSEVPNMVRYQLDPEEGSLYLGSAYGPPIDIKDDSLEYPSDYLEMDPEDANAEGIDPKTIVKIERTSDWQKRIFQYHFTLADGEKVTENVPAEILVDDFIQVGALLSDAQQRLSELIKSMEESK